MEFEYFYKMLNIFLFSYFKLKTHLNSVCWWDYNQLKDYIWLLMGEAAYNVYQSSFPIFQSDPFWQCNETLKSHTINGIKFDLILWFYDKCSLFDKFRDVND